MVSNGAVLGSDPQDLKYRGEPTVLVVGDRTVIREYATLNRGTLRARLHARWASDCLLMAYTHVAHDCRIGNHVILSNAVNMAGHVTIDDWATSAAARRSTSSCASARTRSWAAHRACARTCRPT